MKRLAFLALTPVVLAACGEMATLGTSLITTGTVPGTSFSYRVEKYAEPQQSGSFVATHALVAQLERVSSTFETVRFAFPESAQTHFAQVMPSICEGEGKSLTQTAVFPTFVGNRARIDFQCA